MTDTFDELCVKLTQSVEERINFLRVEAYEIIAFLAMDSEHIVKPGIPPHIPVAYGLKGPSLSKKTFQNMRNDIGMNYTPEILQSCVNFMTDNSMTLL